MGLRLGVCPGVKSGKYQWMHESARFLVYAVTRKV